MVGKEGARVETVVLGRVLGEHSAHHRVQGIHLNHNLPGNVGMGRKGLGQREEHRD